MSKHKTQKLLFVYYKLFKPGGVTRVLISLVNELVAAGYDVTILIMIDDFNTAFELDKRVKLIHINTFAHWGFQKINVNLNRYFPKLPYKNNIKNYVYDFGQWEMFSKWLKQNHHDYDVIISAWYKLSSQIALNKKIASKTIAWEHANFQVGGKLWNATLRKYYKNLKAVVCLNSPSLAHYKSINPNSFLIPNLIGMPFENYPKENLKNKQNTLIYIGRLDDDKNVQETIEILSLTDIKDFKFKIIGDGPSRNNLEKQIQNLPNIANKVEFLGSKKLSEIYDELSNSKVFLFTSKTECLPTVLIEANLTGNALISYNCKYGPSDIVNSENGFLVPFGDKNSFSKNLQFLIDNPDQLADLNVKSFTSSKKWNKTEIINSWIKIF